MRFYTLAAVLLSCVLPGLALRAEAGTPHRFLYVATPGIRDYLQYGGHGVLVFDMDEGHRFVRRIVSAGIGKKGQPLNVKGICGSVATQRLYVSTIETMECFDLVSGKSLWEKRYEGGCDRMAITPDGKKLFTPSFEKDFWHVIDAENGKDLKRIPSPKHAHNTIVSLDGKEAYLADRGSPLLQVVDTSTNEVVRTVGPFGNVIRPFTVNGRHSIGYMNVDDLLGFEIVDLNTGKVLHRMEVPGFKKGPVARHGCPSHGVGLTPDEKEVWVADAHNKQVHFYDNSVTPPKYLQSLTVRDEPGWVTFSLDGKFGYPSTGEVIEVASHKIITALKDETGAEVHSEKMMEIDFDASGKVVAVGDQFGLGRVR